MASDGVFGHRGDIVSAQQKTKYVGMICRRNTTFCLDLLRHTENAYLYHHHPFPPPIPLHSNHPLPYLPPLFATTPPQFSTTIPPDKQPLQHPPNLHRTPAQAGSLRAEKCDLWVHRAMGRFLPRYSWFPRQGYARPGCVSYDLLCCAVLWVVLTWLYPRGAWDKCVKQAGALGRRGLLCSALSSFLFAGHVL